MPHERLSSALIATLAVAGASVAVPATASAKKHKHHKYVGSHPVGAKADGYCFIEAPHVHVYAPARGNKRDLRLLYRVRDGHYYFVGDPIAHGYDGPRQAYYGHHPIALDVVAGTEVEGEPHDLEFCYLDGPHYHAYAPPPDLRFEVKGDLHWYVGTYPPAYEQGKRARLRVNAYYEPVVYARPVVEVGPPDGYVSAVVEVDGPRATVAAPAVVVETPAPRAEVRGGIEVDVRIPTPSLEVEVGLPGVVVVEEHHHVKRKHRHKKHKRAKHYWKRKKHKRKHSRGKRRHD